MVELSFNLWIIFSISHLLLSLFPQAQTDILKCLLCDRGYLFYCQRRAKNTKEKKFSFKMTQMSELIIKIVSN